MQPTPPAQATQTRHPWRATIRTVLAAGVALASLLPDIAITAHVNAVPAVVQIVGVAGIVTRIMAMASVEAWLRRFAPWLAAAPSP